MLGLSPHPAEDEAQQGGGLHQGGEGEEDQVEDPLYKSRPGSEEVGVSGLEEEHRHREILNTFQTQMTTVCVISDRKALENLSEKTLPLKKIPRQNVEIAMKTNIQV